MNFKVGDLVELIDNGKLESSERHLIGSVVTVISVRPCGCGCSLYTCEVTPDISDGRGVASSALRRIPPSTYDGNQAGEWDLCPFNPYKQKERA